MAVHSSIAELGVTSAIDLSILDGSSPQFADSPSLLNVNKISYDASADFIRQMKGPTI